MASNMKTNKNSGGWRKDLHEMVVLFVDAETENNLAIFIDHLLNQAVEAGYLEGQRDTRMQDQDNARAWQDLTMKIYKSKLSPKPNGKGGE